MIKLVAAFILGIVLTWYLNDKDNFTYDASGPFKTIYWVINAATVMACTLACWIGLSIFF